MAGLFLSAPHVGRKGRFLLPAPFLLGYGDPPLPRLFTAITKMIILAGVVLVYWSKM